MQQKLCEKSFKDVTFQIPLEFESFSSVLQIAHVSVLHIKGARESVHKVRGEGDLFMCNCSFWCSGKFSFPRLSPDVDELPRRLFAGEFCGIRRRTFGPSTLSQQAPHVNVCSGC